MAQVTQIQKPSSTGSLGQLASLTKTVKGVAGLVSGDPSGALDVADGSQGLTGQGAPVQNVANNSGSAIDRRLEATAPQANYSGDLAAAEQATAHLPPDQQQQYLPVLRRARMLDAQSRGEV